MEAKTQAKYKDAEASLQQQHRELARKERASRRKYVPGGANEDRVLKLEEELDGLREDMKAKVSMCEELLDAVRACGLFSDADLKVFEDSLLPASAGNTPVR